MAECLKSWEQQLEDSIQVVTEAEQCATTVQDLNRSQEQTVHNLKELRKKLQEILFIIFVTQFSMYIFFGLPYKEKFASLYVLLLSVSAVRC